jgi:UMF1 family MFS transporter
VDKSLYFLLVAGMFLLFSIPCFLFVRERGNPKPQRISPRMAVESTRETIRTLRSGQQYPGLLRFLVGRVFYTDPINTVVSFMTLFTVNVAVASGLAKDQGEHRSEIIMLSAVTFAVLGGFFWGWLTDRIGPKRTLNLVLWCWMGIFTFTGIVGLAGLPLWTMFIVGGSAGFAMGGIWAADRPYMLRLTPPHRIGEFYGLYGMVGRFSAVTGPLIWALVFNLGKGLGLSSLQAQGAAVFTLLALVVVSYVILQPVLDTPRDWSAMEAAAARPVITPIARSPGA